MLAENLSSALDVFKTKAPALVGVDIASTSIKMVELSEAGKGIYRLERYAIEPLPKDVVQDGNIANLDQVGDALRRGFKRLGSRNRNIALAILIVSFVLNFLAAFNETIRRFSFLSLMDYYRPLFVLQGQAKPIREIIILTVIGAVCWTAGGIVFVRRDIRTV